MALIDNQQILDINGNIILSASHGESITGDGTTVIFTGTGVFMRAGIAKDIDGGTYHFTDNDDDPIDGFPNVTAKGVTDFAGTLPIGRRDLFNGLKIVVASATGIYLNVESFQPSD